MYDTILVPIDGSDGAENAVSRAFDLALTFSASIHVLYVAETESEPVEISREQHNELRRPSEKRGRQATARAHEQATELSLDVTRSVREGVPYRIILEYADEHGINLIAMGTHGRTRAERVRLGSTTERVITLADSPVVAVPLTDEERVDVATVDYDRIVIATDGSDAAERAAERGLEIAESYDADVYVTYVIDTTTYDLKDAPRSIVGLLKEGGKNAVEAITADGRGRELSVETDVLRGVPDEEIIEYTDGIDADLVVMGVRGRGGATESFLGSTTARVIRRTTRPILTVG
ncbi:universal stress protein [Natronococcus wangiae]|uniref:universal stress protein n=1 Tax=Natronococcus wangiae TaxID=3068275 RepID=UPI00273D85B7|nr:universal stress protein [Natronococcus sp. AD5]